jgi:hypothetical protein
MLTRLSSFRETLVSELIDFQSCVTRRRPRLSWLRTQAMYWLSTLFMISDQVVLRKVGGINWTRERSI